MALHLTSSWVAALHLLLVFLRPFIQDTLRVCWWYTGKITWPVTSREYGLPGMKLVPKDLESRLEKHWNWNLIHRQRQCVYFWLPPRQLQKVPHSYAFKMKSDGRLDNPDQRIQEDHPKIFEDYKYLALNVWMVMFSAFAIPPFLFVSQCFTIQDIGHFVASSFDLTFGLLDAVIQLGIYSDLAAKAWAAWMIFLLILRFNSRIESCSHCLHWLFVLKSSCPL